MWSYYGSKTKIVNYYPSPRYDLIVEPFAGSARYSLKYFEKDIVLVDKYDVIIGIWEYLKQASQKDILSLPDVESGEFVRDKLKFTSLSKPEQDLMGFCMNRGSNRPKFTGGKFNSWSRDKIRIAENLYKIRHWKIVLGDYKEIQNKECTWFVDPPYEFQHLYVHNEIDYTNLSTWCTSREGQLIVCELVGASWMNFVPLITNNGQRKKSVEAVFLR